MVLAEPAIRFFTMLQEGIKLEAEENLLSIGVVSFPHLTRQKQNEFKNSLTNIINNDAKTGTIESDRRRLRELLKKGKT